MMSVLNSVQDLHHLPGNLGKPKPERPYFVARFLENYLVDTNDK
jgi:hypothetical protein